MTKRSLFFCCFLATLAQAQTPTVTGISVTNDPYTGASSLTHSQLGITFTYSGWTPGVLRIRYFTGTQSSCSSTGGYVFTFTATPTTSTPNTDTTNVSGLQANTAYTICPELSNDGSNFVPSAIPLHVTTLPLPAVHPQPPASPATFSTSYPNTAGYTTVVESSCANWLTDYQTAVSARRSHGTVIELPAGVNCTQQMTQYIPPVDPDVQTIVPNSTTISTANSTITLNTNVSYPIEGNIIRLANTSYSSLPGSGGQQDAGPIISGMPYHMHCYDSAVAMGSACSDGVVQLYACPTLTNGTTPACPFSSGHLEVLTGTGSGSYLAYMTEPHTPNWIIIRTSTPDAQFVPEHSRVQGPPTTDGITQDVYPGAPTNWAPLMAQIQYPYSLITDARGMMQLGCGDCSINNMPTNIRFVGVEFSHAPDYYAYVSGNPMVWGNWWSTFPEASNIVFDRCWFHSNDTPERQVFGMNWQGTNQAIVDSYFDGMNSWRGLIKGMGISGAAGGTSATIATGSAGFGVGHGSIATPASVSWTGTPLGGGNHRIFSYFSMTGNTLNFAFPPGLTPSVSGPSNVHILNLNQAGYGVSYGPASYNGGNSSLTFPTTPEADNYYIDPMVSSSSGCNLTTSLFANLNTTAAPATNPGKYDLGLTFTSDAAQYLCGIRFWKVPSETPTSHTLALWSTGGTLLTSATTTGETASGWQTAMLGTPYPLASATQYVAGYHSSVAAARGALQFQNADYYNANMHVTGAYVNSNGGGNSNDNWPRFVAEANGYEGPYAGGIAYIDINASGTINDVGNADLTTDNSGGITQDQEGTQMLLCGIGPGPYMSVDNYIEGSGNLWHCDNAGGTWDPGRHDYTYYRDYWRMQKKTWAAGPYSDGNIYGNRHFWEHKDGNRISNIGNIFNFNVSDATPTQEPFELSSKDGVTESDVNIRSCTIMHSSGGPLGGVQEDTGGGPIFQPLPAARQWITNCLLYDIDGVYNNAPYTGFAKALGWASDAWGAEDMVWDHNTIFLNLNANSTRANGTQIGSALPLLSYIPDVPFEGWQLTNNFFNVATPNGNGGQYGFAWSYTNSSYGDSCLNATNGESILLCKAGTNLNFRNNVISSSTASLSQLQGAFQTTGPNQYLQAASAGGLGFFGVTGWNFGEAGASSVPNFRLKANFQSGDSSHASDGRDVGANIDLLEADQGFVRFISANPTGTTTASVTVDQPDSGTCTLDYGTEPTVTTFTRVAQACSPGPVTFNLSGLTTQTLYYFRYDGAVSQPIGQFKTH